MFCLQLCLVPSMLCLGSVGYQPCSVYCFIYVLSTHSDYVQSDMFRLYSVYSFIYVLSTHSNHVRPEMLRLCSVYSSVYVLLMFFLCSVYSSIYVPSMFVYVPYTICPQFHWKCSAMFCLCSVYVPLDCYDPKITSQG